MPNSAVTVLSHFYNSLVPNKNRKRPAIHPCFSYTGNLKFFSTCLDLEKINMSSFILKTWENSSKCQGGYISGCRDGQWVSEWVDGWMDGQTDWMHACMDRWNYGENYSPWSLSRFLCKSSLYCVEPTVNPLGNRTRTASHKHLARQPLCSWPSSYPDNKRMHVPHEWLSNNHSLQEN